jgi:tRNA threonylcarbamoyladenosine biosynthesis protein TsaE
MQSLALFLPDEVATQAVASAFAPALQPGSVIWLQGDLGAGKTTFMRALLRALGVGGNIKSPTFALVEPYDVVLPGTSNVIALYHFDFYRCTDPEEWRDAGFAEYFDADAPSICAIEWPSRQQGLPAPDWLLELVPHNDGRTLTITARTPSASQWLSKASASLTAAA